MYMKLHEKVRGMLDSSSKENCKKKKIEKTNAGQSAWHEIRILKSDTFSQLSLSNGPTGISLKIQLL